MWGFVRNLLHLLDAFARWYIVRSLEMAAPRRFKDRRRRDPMNIENPPLAAAIMCEIDGGDPSDFVLTYNCPVTKVGSISGVAVDEVSVVGGVQTAPNQITFTAAGPLSGGERVDCGPFVNLTPGPNTTWGVSALIALAP